MNMFLWLPWQASGPHRNPANQDRLSAVAPIALITFAAAVGRISFTNFIAASSLGKIPALLMEGYSVYEVTRFGWQGKLILSVIALALAYWIIKKIMKQKN